MTIAGTGHRPNKLGGYGSSTYLSLLQLASDWLRDKSGLTVISGMALGWDQALCEAALNLNIPVIAAIPFKGQESMWPAKSQVHYRELLEKVMDTVYVCDPGYSAAKMQIRNEFMVDHCDLVLALHDGSTGGTYNCIQYAIKCKKPVHNLWDKYQLILKPQS